MTKELFDYQKKDVEHLLPRKSALVAHQPRVGKTPISIRVADRMNAKIMIAVVPANAVNNWMIAIDEFRQGNWIGIVVPWSMVTKFLPRWRKSGLKADLVVIDESHYAKNRSAARTRAVYGPKFDGEFGVVHHADKALCLTGTPLPTAPDELWPMLRAIAPELITVDGRPMSYSRFCDRYVKYQRTPFGRKVVGSKNYKELRDILKKSGFMIRRTRQEVFGRDIRPPVKVYIDPPLDYAKRLRVLEQSPAGKAMIDAMKSGGLKALNKLDSTEVGAIRQLYGLAKVPGVVDLAIEELKAEPGSKLVLFAWHTEVVRALAAGLKSYGAITFYGKSGSADAKHRLNQKFLTDPKCRVIVCQIISAAVGLDFSAAHHAMFAEESYVGTDNEQAMARIFNVASKEPKFISRIVLKGTNDETIMASADGRLRDQSRIID